MSTTQPNLLSFFGKKKEIVKPKELSKTEEVLTPSEQEAPISDYDLEAELSEDADDLNESDDSSLEEAKPLKQISKELVHLKLYDTSKTTHRPVIGSGAKAGSKARGYCNGTPESIGYVKDPTIEHHWKAGAPVPYLEVAKTFTTMESTTKRLDHLEMLCNLFRAVLLQTPKDFVTVLYLCSDMIGPPYEELELGVGDALLIQCLADTSGTKVETIKKHLKDKTDLGDLAQDLKSTQRLLIQPAPLTCSHIFKMFREIALSGKRDEKKGRIMNMFAACRQNEIKFLVRTLQGKLRSHLGMKTILGALAHAAAITKPSSAPQDYSLFVGELCEARAIVESAWALTNSFDKISAAIVNSSGGVRGLEDSCTITPGVPIMAMLAKPMTSAKEAIQKVSAFGEKYTCEYKYDGQRAQFHFPEGAIKSREDDGQSVKSPSASPSSQQPALQGLPIVTLSTAKGHSPSVFSRNCENLTGKFPDALQIVAAAYQPKPDSEEESEHEGETEKDEDSDEMDEEPASSSNTKANERKASHKKHAGSGAKNGGFILDTEVVAFDRETNCIQPFQTLSTRSKKDVRIDEIKVQVCVMAFDLLYYNGETMMNKPLSVRRKVLRENFVEIPKMFQFASFSDPEDEEAMMETMEASVKAKCEGLMVKSLNAGYVPGRSYAWVKLKKDYLNALGDSFDLVPIGAKYGTGKRNSWFGSFLLACYNPELDTFQTVTKIGTGFDEEFLKTFPEEAADHIKTNPPENVSHSTDPRLKPDVWFEPWTVWEVKGSEFSISPLHTAASEMFEDGRGLALRFPRFLRVRPDKSPEDATTAEQIMEAYNSQENKVEIGGNIRKKKGKIDEDDL
ncbi:DNA ligase I, LIG1 [Monocercomonoides exilis]|uniref:DNA ligase I, LIG1 n=1 Tax=Monocercomonoides exilis TaxID=2049356 RepID=UPI00355A1E78|nr:DNA ligase I, LIG1 [Monocercomonoides exilis]|eukprot:MONOS_838.1-p1 / transcript=MONOS_838.1 / gene=MONOS_838 / organism=Monocercomonoides_exilis_PA203 / gene_product=DNA ligase I, LIG1 / transcript_product=DNA ligase I, LIG1 / location=Mono_scaffold00014:34038-37221(+) / protein_length=848 / sequence_SO=supercontig / SO=protein_coding / is_pseudo=false